MKLEKYSPVSGNAYNCDVEGCHCKATWRIIISNEKTELLCDKHKKEKDK